MNDSAPARRSTLLLALVPFTLWGLFPLYFHFLREMEPSRIIAHRAVWAGVLSAGLLLLLRRGQLVRWWRGPEALRDLRRLLVTAALLGGNWSVYMYAVTRGHVLEASLGYFICPLVSVALGVFVLHERLSRVQWVALGVASAGVLQMAVRSGGVPVLALFLAVSFALYGLFRKRIELDPLLASTLESLLMAPVGGLWLLFGTGDTPLPEAVSWPLLMGTGVVTVVPLVLYVMAARRLPYSTLGMLQYITPTLQLAIGVLFAHEVVDGPRALMFGLIWAALGLLSVQAVRTRFRPASLAPAQANP